MCQVEGTIPQAQKCKSSTARQGTRGRPVSQWNSELTTLAVQVRSPQAPMTIFAHVTVK